MDLHGPYEQTFTTDQLSFVQGSIMSKRTAWSKTVTLFRCEAHPARQTSRPFSEARCLFAWAFSEQYMTFRMDPCTRRVFLLVKSGLPNERPCTGAAVIVRQMTAAGICRDTCGIAVGSPVFQLRSLEPPVYPSVPPVQRIINEGSSKSPYKYLGGEPWINAVPGFRH